MNTKSIKVEYKSTQLISILSQTLPEFQIIISFNKPEEVEQVYKERWQIETAFRALKSSGFNIILPI